MIRSATLDDLPAIVKMGEAFFAESCFSDLVRFDPESFADTARKIINGDVDGSFLVAEGGMAASVFYSLYVNRLVRAAQELFWYAVPEKRNGLGRMLLNALELDAQLKGVNLFMGTATAGLRDEAVGRLYRMRGFNPAEHTYIKRL